MNTSLLKRLGSNPEIFIGIMVIMASYIGYAFLPSAMEEGSIKMGNLTPGLIRGTFVFLCFLSMGLIGFSIRNLQKKSIKSE